MVTAVKEISMAHSPDSDDAFMFYGLACGCVETYGITVNQVMKDIQSLNNDAKAGLYDVTAISFAAYAEIADSYALMTCGASMGLNYGPMLVSRADIEVSDLRKLKLAIPGSLTSAYMTLRLLEPKLNTVELPFDQILEQVRDRKVDAGLIIHEGQLTYKEMGLKKILDLGEWWSGKTGGLPLPLGANVGRKALGEDLLKKSACMLKDSICFALEHRQEALSYALKFGRGLTNEDADKYVGMYVNELTVDFGEPGRKAVRLFFDMAYENGILPKKLNPEFVEL